MTFLGQTKLLGIAVQCVMLGMALTVTEAATEVILNDTRVEEHMVMLAQVSAADPAECSSLCSSYAENWQGAYDDTLHYDCEVREEFVNL